MEKITATVTRLTTANKDVIDKTTSATFELNAGYSANICYTNKTLDDIKEEDITKTMDRAERTRESGHHSVFGHDHITLYFDGIPKIIAMLINNEKEYNTSEKSGRYTTMQATGKELEMYNKWIDKLDALIKMSYKDEKYLTDKMIKKKALENARYMLSIFTRTKMEYTTSYRQLNYIYGFTNKMIKNYINDPLITALKPYLEEFRDCLEETGFIDKSLVDNKCRKFSMITEYNNFNEQFGRTYSTNYLATFSALAELQRHRTIDYSLSTLNRKDYYVPELIKQDYPILIDEWKNDMAESCAFPQGMLVNVNEAGTYEAFLLKLCERLCTAAQLEVATISKETLNKYIEALRYSNEISDQYIYQELLRHSSGARCTFPEFECKTPCGFKEGICLKRKI